ncbi:MAG: glycosyltransferase family 9 protein [Candidatus Aureabacteria bacterium]|nr:glycosyltransferase family 9 protein [Candidatus Auribacterota bacterium]
MERVKADCRFLRWDRPCAPHKKEGVHCAQCSFYKPVKERVLIVKLDALGDVLRTTCILPALKKKRGRSQLTWITMPDAVPLLESNPFIDRVIAYGADALGTLGAERFDLVLCLDAAPRSAALGSLAKGRIKKGFGLDACGRVFPFNLEAREWFLMGLFDDIKKRNTRTYQEIVMEICGLKGLDQEIVLRLTDAEKAFARRFAERAGLPAQEVKSGKGHAVIGVNTGSGNRWPMKQWPIPQCVDFIRGLLAEKRWTVLLFGGEEETARNAQIKEGAGEGLIDTGCRNSVREFVSLVDLCDVLVTSDTLGLHVALGLGKKVIGLFGPTSAAEIDVYGRGVKIVSDADCTCCYRRTCGRTPSCMGMISADIAREAVGKILAG